MFRKIINNKEGLTLLELTVAVAIFSVMMLALTQIFNMVIRGQRNAIAAQNIQESMRYAMEVMSKEIRMAQKDVGGPGQCPLVGNGDVYSINAQGDKLYLKNYDEGLTEEYFGVYYKEGNISEDKKQKLVLGYWNEDNIDMDGKKYLTVVIYTGKNSSNFIIPDYGNINFSYAKFKKYFDKPISNTLDITDNPLENLREKNVMNVFQLKIFLSKLHKRIGYALKLMDKKNSQ